MAASGGELAASGGELPAPGGEFLAYGVLEELYRRRRSMALLLLLGCGVIAAAVGLQVWGTAGPAASALRTGAIGGAPSRSGDPMFDLVSDSSTGIDGPSGTWKQWGDLGSQRRSIAPAAEPARSSTTTFPDVNGGGARVQRASETTTTTTP